MYGGDQAADPIVKWSSATLITCDCNCKPEEPYICGAAGEFYTEKEGSGYAAMRWATRRSQDRAGYVTHWGVHYEGKHILLVRA